MISMRNLTRRGEIPEVRRLQITGLCLDRLVSADFDSCGQALPGPGSPRGLRKVARTSVFPHSSWEGTRAGVSRRWRSARLLSAIGLVAVCFCRTSPLPAEQPGSADQAVRPARILASLGEQTITSADVDFHLAREAGQMLAPLSTAAQQAAVHLIALQRQSLQTLRALKQAASREEIDSWVATAAGVSRAGAKSTAEIVAEICQRSGVESNKFLDFADFRLSWQRYLARHLTDANLARHFANQTARFDGTRFRIDLLSIAVPAGMSPMRRSAQQNLKELRPQLLASDQWDQSLGRIAFKEVQLLSHAWVRGCGDLDPTLITALLNAELGQLSSPIDTATGVHLVRLLEVEAGKLELPDVEGEVRAHLLIYLLEHLARQSASQLPLVARPSVRVAAISFVPTKFDLPGNAARLEKAFRDAAQQNAQIAVAPEGVLEGYVVNQVIAGEARPEAMRDVALQLNHPVLQKFQRLAAELKMCLVFGFAEKVGDELFNAAVFIDAAGQICGTHHKMQLAEGSHPAWWFNRLGAHSRAFDTPYGRCGMMICNERWNPTLAKILALDGAQLLLIPSYGSVSKAQDEAVLQLGRDNQLPVVEANVGVAMVVNESRIIALDRNPETILFADIDIPPASVARPEERDRLEREFLDWRQKEMGIRYNKTLSKLAEKSKNSE